jgi:hypothetical protein
MVTGGGPGPGSMRHWPLAAHGANARLYRGFSAEQRREADINFGIWIKPAHVAR